MKRRLTAVSAVLVVSASLLGVFGSGVAGALAPAATGSVVCSVSGKGTFTPTLTLAGSATPLHIAFGATATGGCFSAAQAPNSAGLLTPVTITGVSITGIGTMVPLSTGLLANKCAVFKGSDTIGVIKVHYSWISVPAIAPTTVTYTGGTAHIVSGSPLDNIVLPATSGTTWAGTGSFTPSVHPLVGLRTNVSSTCAAGWGPYPTFLINPGSLIALP